MIHGNPELPQQLNVSLVSISSDYASMHTSTLTLSSMGCVHQEPPIIPNLEVPNAAQGGNTAFVTAWAAQAALLPPLLPKMQMMFTMRTMHFVTIITRSFS
jgi:hypothetical protein